MRTLIIDAQIWQTNAWYRGMGGYTRSLVSTLTRQNEDLHIVLLLNKNLETDPRRLEAIHGEFPDATIVELDLPVDPLPKDDAAAKATIQHLVDHEFNEGEVYYLIM